MEIVLAHGAGVPPPIPDLAAAAEILATGRGWPIEDAIVHALAVDLSRPPAMLPLAIISAVPATPAPNDHTPRQEILDLMCERLTDREIAARLFIGPRTVESHVAHILGKLGVENRRDAAAVAARLVLV